MRVLIALKWAGASMWKLPFNGLVSFSLRLQRCDYIEFVMWIGIIRVGSGSLSGAPVLAWRAVIVVP